MIHFFLLLVFLTCAGVVSAWLAENPGHVTIEWFGYRADTSFALLLALALAAAALLAGAYLLLRRLVLAPEGYRARRGARHYRRGLTELTYSVAALASADTKEAALHTRNAEKLLGRTPLTLLLSAQIARSAGDDDKTRALLAQMLEHKETEYLAARFLSDSASKQRAFPKALALARRAHSLNPGAIAPLLDLHLRLGEWQQALAVIEQTLRKGRLSRAQTRHYKAAVFHRQGTRLLEDGQHEGALAAARQCLKWQPDFVPCVLLAAKAYAACGVHAKAIKLIFRAWKTSPHPQLAEALRAILAREPKEKQLKTVRKLAALSPAAYESDLALAEMALHHRDWKTARQALTAALAKAETARVCALIARMEEGEHPYSDSASKWIARGSSAAPDPAWICQSCGKAAEAWNSHCPACEAFDTLEWKKREMAFAG